MDWLEDIRTGFAALAKGEGLNWSVIAADLLGNWFIQFVIVTLLVWLTIKIIAHVYAGDVQNTPLGPLALRAHDGGPPEQTQRIWAPRAILPPSMNGQHAYCRFFYAYDDAKGERHYEELRPDKKDTKAQKRWSKPFLFEIRDRRYPKVGDELLGRELVDDVRTEDVSLQNPDLDRSTPPETVEKTPTLVSEWLSTQAPRDFQVSGTEIVSVPNGLRDTLSNAREEYIQRMASAVARRRKAVLKLGSDDRSRAGVIGYYYMKVSFNTSTRFILFKHPDRDLKMTAWLTVLTSLFGFLIGKMP
ncbi:MAG: hypothetical protein AB7F85_09135 [Hyphomonadaceae bacterium]